MADYVEENFAKGDSVVVKAIMGRNVDQPFIGVEIMPTKRLFDEKFGLDTQRGPYPNDFSEALLMGEVYARVPARKDRRQEADRLYEHCYAHQQQGLSAERNLFRQETASGWLKLRAATVCA